MKKSSVFIICFLLLVIIALTCFVIYYTKITNEKLDALTANNVEKNETKNEVVEEDDKEKYAGLTVDEWKDAVRKVMTKKLNYEPDEIDVRIENDEMQIGIGKGYSVDYDFKVDSETKIAKDEYSGLEIDFINGKILPTYKDISFSDNLCLAIGYVLDDDVNTFKDKYFKSGALYSSTETFDFREESMAKEGYGNRFILIPQNSDVEIKVYNCHVGEDGQLYTDDVVIDNISMPIIILDDYIEYTPALAVELHYNGFECMFPLTFSGENGHLDLTGVESEVLDISLYN